MLKKTSVLYYPIYFSLFLCFLLLTACDSQQTTTQTNSHSTYSFHGPVNYSTQAHSGDLIQLDWKPKLESTSSAAAPDAILLQVQLVGPFTSPEAVQAGIQQSKAAHDIFAKNSIVASANPILTDTWSNSPRSSLLAVPGKLQAGYYDLFYATILTTKGKIIITRSDAQLHLQ